MTPARRLHTVEELRAVAADSGVDAEYFERDYVLVTIAMRLVERFGDSIVFKGGFVLRHVYGQQRLSKDIDATRAAPPREAFDAADVKSTIELAGRGALVRIRAQAPATNSDTSLDFDPIRYSGGIARAGQVAVEISYREGVVLPAVSAIIGEPFYDPFSVLALAPAEIIAEKLRALCQRTRPTDLADLATVYSQSDPSMDEVRVCMPFKFAAGLVRDGDHSDRIRANIDAMRMDYERSISSLAPQAPEYRVAANIATSVVDRAFGGWKRNA